MEIEQTSTKSGNTTQSTNVSYIKGKFQKILSLYTSIMQFPMITSPWISSIIFLLNAIVFLHLLDFYYRKVQQLHPNDSSGLKFHILAKISSSWAPIGYTLNGILSIFILLTFFFNQNKYEGLKYILAWLGIKLFPFLRYLIEINVIIAAIFFVNDNYSAITFILAAALNIVVTFFSQNYSLRKDYLCCKSMPFLMLQKITIILIYGLNCIIDMFIKNNIAFLITLIIHLLLALLLCICYFLFGYVIYRHVTPRILMALSLSFYFSLSLALVYDQANRIMLVYPGNNQIYYIVLFWLSWSALFYAILQNMRRGSTKSSAKLTQKIYFLFNKLQGSSQSIEDDCQTRGIIRYHTKMKCENPLCFANRPQSLYDSKKNRLCSIDKINQGKTSLVKFYIKCLYQTQLEKCQWKNTDLLLQYIEFYYMKLKNIFRVTHLQVILEGRFLSPFQRLRLFRLKRVMNQQNFKLNGQLYAGNLDIEWVIDSENTFQIIREQVNTVLKKNFQFWQYLNQNEINLSQMITLMKPSFQMIQKINRNWKNIVKYFEIQKIWKFYFACYTLFIKNEKLKQPFIQYFGLNVHEDDIFQQTCFNFEKTAQLSKLYNSKMLFESHTCFIHINGHLEQPLIKRVSSFFYKMFKYTENEIIESSIENLMTLSIRSNHQKSFLLWAAEGKGNNEPTYQVKSIFPLDKNGYIVPVFKLYKQFYSLKNELQYVAMLKKNKEQQCVAILNQNYEIQGTTSCFLSKFNIKQQQYEFLLSTNILIFFPSVVDHTKFQAITKNLTEQIENKGQSSNSNHSVNQFGRKTSTASKKDFNKSNIKAFFPDNIQQSCDKYKRIKTEGQNQNRVYDGIKAGYQDIKTGQNPLRVYKTELQIKEKNLHGTTYYQLYIRDIQEVQTTLYSSKTIKKSQNEEVKQHIQNKSNIGVEQFHKFFESTHNNQTISLSFASNIFIKQDNNRPVQMISVVSTISASVKIIFLFFLALAISGLIVEVTNIAEFDYLQKKMTSLIPFKLNNFMLQNQYFAELNGIPDKKFKEKSENFLVQFKKNYYLKKCFIEDQSSKSQTFTPNKNTPLKALNLTTPLYSSTDLIDRLMESVFTIQNYTLDNPKIYQSFLYYYTYLRPGYQQINSNILNQLIYNFRRVRQITEIKNYVFYSVVVILMIVGFIILLMRIISISHSFVELLKIFTQFSQQDLMSIQKYCNFLINLFGYLENKNNSIVKQSQIKPQWNVQGTISQNGQGMNEGEDAGLNLNKKIKKVQIGNQMSSLKIKSIVFIVLFLLIYGISTISVCIYATLMSSSILTMQEQGESLFRYYGVMDIQLSFLFEKKLDKWEISQRSNDPSTYMLQKMKQIRTRMGSNSRFGKKYDAILFDNFCQIYPQVLENNETEIKQCITTAQNTLQHGAQSFLYLLSADLQNHLRDTKTASDINITRLNQMHKALKYCDIYFSDLLLVWKQQFQEFSSEVTRNTIIICICHIILQILIYVVLIEILVVGTLKNKFLFFKRFYEYYMPQFVVSKEKTIRASLYVEGFIHK